MAKHDRLTSHRRGCRCNAILKFRCRLASAFETEGGAGWTIFGVIFSHAARLVDDNNSVYVRHLFGTSLFQRGLRFGKRRPRVAAIRRFKPIARPSVATRKEQMGATKLVNWKATRRRRSHARPREM